jgi:hypothetical protein
MSILSQKHEELKSVGFDLGEPLIEEQFTPDNMGFWCSYEKGNLYSQDGITAWEVHDPILEKYYDLGETVSVLGYPTSDQIHSRDGAGCYNYFEQGAIYWRPDTGAWEVHGAIYSKYILHGAEAGNIGYPVSDEYDEGDGKRRSDFSFGYIEWSVDDGARYFVNGVEQLDPITIVGNPERFSGMNLSQVDFYLAYSSYAEQTEEENHVPALFSLAQAGVESGWGNAKPGNAMFGIKAGRNWTGTKQLLKTREVFSSPDIRSFPEVISVTQIDMPGNTNNGKYLYVVRDWFRSYDSPKDSFDDHAAFLWARYPNAFSSQDPYKFARIVAVGGYASTDPQEYYAALSAAIRQLEAIRYVSQLED